MSNSNQFRITDRKGRVDASTANRLYVGKIDDAEAHALVAGQCVKIKDVAGRVLPLTASTINTDKHAGVLVATTHRSEYEAGDMVEFAPARSGAIVIMEASKAIANGAVVYPVIAGAKVTDTKSGQEVAVGHAYDKATADGDLIRVILDL